jgi:outer membrane protein TolC
LSEDNLKRFRSTLILSDKVIPYLGTDLEANLFVNPFNTRDGELRVSLVQPLSPQRIFESFLSEKSTRDNLNIAEIQRDIAKQNLILEVVNSYFGLVRILNSIKRVEQSIKSTESLIEVIKVKVEGGLAAPSELSNFYLQRNLEMASYEELLQSFRTAKEEFLRLLGIEIEDSLVLQEDIPLNVGDFDLETCWKRALQKNPELMIFKIQLNQIEGNLKAQKLYFFPDVNFSLNYTRPFEVFSGILSPQMELSLQWPLFTAGILKSRKKLAEEQYKLALFNYEELKYRLRKEIENLLFQIEVAKKKLKLYEASRELAAEALRVAELRYRSGALSYQEYYFNLQRYEETEENYFNLKTEVFILYTRLLRLMGELNLERILQ